MHTLCAEGNSNVYWLVNMVMFIYSTIMYNHQVVTANYLVLLILLIFISYAYTCMQCKCTLLGMLCIDSVYMNIHVYVHVHNILYIGSVYNYL